MIYLWDHDINNDNIARSPYFQHFESMKQPRQNGVSVLLICARFTNTFPSLVGGLEHFFHIWNNHPNWLIFIRGLKLPTSIPYTIVRVCLNMGLPIIWFARYPRGNHVIPMRAIIAALYHGKSHGFSRHIPLISPCVGCFLIPQMVVSWLPRCYPHGKSSILNRCHVFFPLINHPFFLLVLNAANEGMIHFIPYVQHQQVLGTPVVETPNGIIHNLHNHIITILFTIILKSHHISTRIFTTILHYLAAHPTDRKWVTTLVINGTSGGNVHL